MLIKLTKLFRFHLLVTLLLFSYTCHATSNVQIVTKQEACSLDRTQYGMIGKFGTLGKTYSQPLEVTGLKNASIEEFSRAYFPVFSDSGKLLTNSTGDNLYYIVRQKGTYKVRGNLMDDYSIYMYDCQTKKAYRKFWQLTFRKITEKIPNSEKYPHASIRWLGGRYISLSFKTDPSDKKRIDYYDVSIDYSRSFSISHIDGLGEEIGETKRYKY